MAREEKPTVAWVGHEYADGYLLAAALPRPSGGFPSNGALATPVNVGNALLRVRR